MLSNYPVFVDLPAADIARARKWYQEKLGFSPIRELGAGLVYASGGLPFLLCETAAAGVPESTAASWIVDDLGLVMHELRSRGIEFKANNRVEMGPTTVNGVAIIANGGLAAWFRDSEGNELCINQLPLGMTLSDLVAGGPSVSDGPPGLR